MIISIDEEKAFDEIQHPFMIYIYIYTSIYSIYIYSPESGHRGNLHQHNKGHIGQTHSKHHSQW